MNAPRKDELKPGERVRDDVVEMLFRDEAGGIMRYLRRNGRSHADAQDLLQDAFVQFSKARISGDPIGYLRRITRNLLVSRVRRDRRWSSLIAEKPFDEQIALASPPQQHLNIEACDVKRQYQRIIDGLPEKTRTIYLMHRIDGLSYVDIAHAMNLSSKSVEYHISSALKSLVRGLDQE